MSSVLQLIIEGERLDSAQMAQVLNLSEADVESEIQRLKAEHSLLGALIAWPLVLVNLMQWIPVI